MSESFFDAVVVEVVEAELVVAAAVDVDVVVRTVVEETEVVVRAVVDEVEVVALTVVEAEEVAVEVAAVVELVLDDDEVGAWAAGAPASA